MKSQGQTSNQEIIRSRFGATLCSASLQEVEDGVWFLIREGERRLLCVIARPGSHLLNGFEGRSEEHAKGLALKVCPTTSQNCAALRRAIPSLRPTTLGLKESFGFGDRLGMATPGHVRALQGTFSGPRSRLITPIFAQQSVRENTRTGRTPQGVLDDATWGAFEGGWRGRVGADADHLKTLGDVEAFAQAGYSLFTIDPGEHVDRQAEFVTPGSLRAKIATLPWSDLETSVEDLLKRYEGEKIDLGVRELRIEKDAIMSSAAKYGKAVVHVVRMARHIASKNIQFELEISVDETETPTSALDHFYIASELRRLGIRWVSLAPRYVGSFEKAIDYRGDVSALQTSLIEHAAIASQLGPYKLGLHSGSDKFTVYPLIHGATNGLVHVKTAGTSYMEGLRVIASTAPELFRRIATLAIERFPEDRRSYHLSAELTSMPALSTLDDAELSRLLGEDSPRQVLHVAFGSVLDAYGGELKAVLAAHLEEYYSVLERHFSRHLSFLV